MTEYIKDLERRKPGDPAPPFNTGPYDNPLVWNYVDPFAADRSHQRRPLTVHRTILEELNIPYHFRDVCSHRLIPWVHCCKAVRPHTFGHGYCIEFKEAYIMCVNHEFYRLYLLKRRFIELTKNYTNEDKKFFPTGHFARTGEMIWPNYSNLALSMRMCGWDEKDPANPLFWKEPNRVLMRTEFSPTNWERGIMTSSFGHKLIDNELIEKELPGMPLPESLRPQ